MRLCGAGEDNGGKRDSRGRNGSAAYIGYIYKEETGKMDEKIPPEHSGGKSLGLAPQNYYTSIV
jgi:hypothetical protein